MKIKVTIVTATRAEYGLLKPLIEKLQNYKDFNLSLIVTGSHLSSQFGMTKDEIIADGFETFEEINILEESDDARSITKSMATALTGFAESFAKARPDLLIVLGDRYEILAVTIAAYNDNIAIAHLHGGETTTGALDEAYRHSITKMSHLHFCAAEEYRRRIIQLGEHPSCVFTVGAPGVDNILSLTLKPKEQLFQELGLKKESKIILVTYHAETLVDTATNKNIKEILAALERFKEHTIVITAANADSGGREINRSFKRFSQVHENVIFINSLGLLNFLSMLSYAEALVGNSSSGIIEAPSLRTPTVNIGNRQKGRLKAASVLDCKTKKDDISDAINEALQNTSSNEAAFFDNPYGGGKSSQKILDVLQQIDFPIQLEKSFYDIKVET